MGRGKFFENGLGSGGGHGGDGGDGYYDGNFIEGGVAYGDADLPCELGSGSGNDSLAGATAGGGIIGKAFSLMSLLIFFTPERLINYYHFSASILYHYIRLSVY